MKNIEAMIRAYNTAEDYIKDFQENGDLEKMYNLYIKGGEDLTFDQFAYIVKRFYYYTLDIQVLGDMCLYDNKDDAWDAWIEEFDLDYETCLRVFRSIDNVHPYT